MNQLNCQTPRLKFFGLIAIGKLSVTITCPTILFEVIKQLDDSSSDGGKCLDLLLLENPALYLNELCLMIKQATSIDISPPTVCRVIRRPVKRLTSGFTKKGP